MALIVEDGTGKADAESYISVADASTYHTARGNAEWAVLASDTVREQCLRKATAYMVQAYRMRWHGARVLITQALDWPRAFVPHPDAAYAPSVPNNTVPIEVKNACAELALKAATTDLLADTTQQVIREKIGPMDTEYDKFSPQDKRYAAVESMIYPYLIRTGNAMQIVRT